MPSHSVDCTVVVISGGTGGVPFGYSTVLGQCQPRDNGPRIVSSLNGLGFAVCAPILNVALW